MADHNAAAAAAIAAAALLASDDDEPGDIHDKFAGQTGGLLQRFRPGQSMDAEIEAYETDQAAATNVGGDVEAPVIAAAVVADAATADGRDRRAGR